MIKKSEGVQLNAPSDIEVIGRALFGDVWVAQLARLLKNKQGKTLPQSSLKSMRDRNTLPDYILVQLEIITEERVSQITEIKGKYFTKRHTVL